MTTPEAINELADRVEREEPSRELDCAVAMAVYGGEVLHIPAQYTGDVYFALKLPSKAHLSGFSQNPVERYTTSLDAAVTLVPANFSYELTFSAAGEGAMRRARLWDWRRGPLMIDPANEWAATAKTLPAALTAAALRARAADMQARAVGAPHPSRTA